ncbi:MAG: EAL domain-containing protein [Lachnospiraceae bacterium]|nr:EAL domain-containing protein [Lachnospiraceae bacterium]
MNNARFDAKKYDAMTQVYTKEYFMSEADAMIMAHPEIDFSVVELDVNRLTMINDIYGLGEGDRLLKYMAETLNMVLEEVEYSIYARVHADLFVFLCPYSKQNLNSYISAIEKRATEFSSNLNFELLISFGVYIVTNRDLSISSMCERANLALKSVKGNYVNHVGIFDKKMHDKAVKEVEITSKMNAALMNGEFEVYFQPKHNLDGEKLIGAEALVRWNSPDNYTPSDFIHIFEENGFIMKLDYYVWEETCKFISSAQSVGVNVPPISVNVSRVDLYNPDLVNILMGLVKKYAIAPNLLKLEFTESAYSESEQLMLSVMEEFHQHGLEVDMDDFGSGYSSLNMLKDVPIDGLKIDLRFLDKSNDERKSNRILAAVIHMAKWLGIPAIVEGVETPEQVSHLKNLGCTMVQGFYFAKPMPAKQFIQYIKDREHNIEPVVSKPFDEEVLDPDKWWEYVISDCEAVLEMHDCYLLCDRGEGEELEIILASDSFYEVFGTTRERMYNLRCNITDFFMERDKERVMASLDSLKDYHSIGQEIYRISCPLGTFWIHVKARLLEKNEEHGVYFCIVDNITQEILTAMKGI